VVIEAARSQTPWRILIGLAERWRMRREHET
jgi:hypothetical protein